MHKIFKKTISLIIGLLMSFSLVTTIGFAQNANSVIADAAAGTYYSSVTATSGTALLGQLHDLLTKTRTKYTTYADCKNYGVTTDPGSASGTVLEFYTHIDIKNSNWDVSGGWNREHVWAKSLSGGTWETDGGGSDLHHIRPAEKDLNNHRGNMRYGEVGSGAKEEYTSVSNVLGGHSVGSNSTGTFEPLDNVKGDVARIVMYVYTQYNRAANVSGTVSDSTYFGNLKFTQIMSASNEDAAKKLLLKWNALDPVDEIETVRNEAVYKIQGNRNPFIDNSDYANAIWGDGTSVEPPAITALTVNPSSLNLNVGAKGNLSVTVTPSGANGNVTWNSDNPAVATVSASGTVTATGVGTAKIYATSTTVNTVKNFAMVTVTEGNTDNPPPDPDNPPQDGAITIDIKSFKSLTGAYATQTWQAGGIGGTAYIFGGTTDKLQFNSNQSGRYLASNVATAKPIKSITVKLNTGSKQWKLLTSNSPYNVSSGNPSEGTDQGTQTVTTEGVKWEISGSFTYFALVYADNKASYIDSVIIELGDGSTITPDNPNPEPSQGVEAFKSLAVAASSGSFESIDAAIKAYRSLSADEKASVANSAELAALNTAIASYNQKINGYNTYADKANSDALLNGAGSFFKWIGALIAALKV